MNFKGLKLFLLTWCVTGFSTLFSQSQDYKKEFQSNQVLFYKYATKENIDSSLIYLKISEEIVLAKPDINLLHLLYLQKSNFYKLKSDYVTVIKNIRPAYNYFKQKGDITNELECVYVLGSYYFANSMYDSTIYLCTKYTPIAMKQKDERSVAFLLFLHGKCLSLKGREDEAADIIRQALKYSEETKNDINIIQSLLALSNIYIEVNAEFAIHHLNRARKYLDKVSLEQKNSIYTALGNSYRNIGKFDSALYFYRKNLEFFNKEDDPTHYGAMIGNIGNVYLDMGRLDDALKNQFESLEYFKRASDSLDIEIALGTIGDIYLKKGNYQEALKYYQKSTAMSERLGFVEELIYNYTGLYQCYEKIGNFKEAYRTYKLYHKFNDSLRNVETAKRLTEQELNYRFDEQKKQSAVVQQAKDDLTAEQIKRQKLTIYVVLGGGVVLLVFLFMSIRNSNIRKRINTQLELSHTEINQQKNIIEIKNREITDSIMYASRIQEGILPDAEEIKSLLPNSFLFYRPRDIVSGDFYWIKPLKGNSKTNPTDSVGVVVADCTGHGVPGAFMSFIGSTILNQTQGNKKIETPADALNYLNEQLPLTLQSKVKTGQINDGMEAGIFTFDKNSHKLIFAGANLNLIHIRNNVASEIKGDKHSIGLNVEQQKTFKNSELTLEKGDCIYMFTDGYPDQFGGEKGKKYKYKNLINFLTANSKLSSAEQYKLISENFDSWKGNLEQLDDVLLFGLKV